MIVYLAITFDQSNPNWMYNVYATVLLIGGHSLTYVYYQRKIAKHGLPELHVPEEALEKP